MNDFTIVIPTIGRPELYRVLERVRAAPDVVVVDDRRDGTPLSGLPPTVRTIRTGGGKGPAAARNLGWRTATAEWVVFLDDDVVPTVGWMEDLRADLAGCGPNQAASQGRVDVPLPEHRPPTDRERNVAGLARARWITADMAYRRAVLEAVGGFDERFRRAFREDSDLALRVDRQGWDIAEGKRRVLHPVRPAPWWVSVGDQRGNRDDVLMRRLHGPDWRQRAAAGTGRAGRHLSTTLLLAAALGLAVSGRGRAAAAAGTGWAALTAGFARERLRPGPRTAPEVAAMTLTSIAIPPVATFWKAAGILLDRRLADRPGPGQQVEAVLFDRDGTLVLDVPYNGDPDRVVPVPAAARTVQRLRAEGVAIGMVTNQSGVGRGIITADQVERVNRRVEDLVGPLDTVVYCPHTPEDDCRCRKPAPGLILEAARRLGVAPSRCVVVGDILSDVLAAEAAGARAILVPNPRTAPGETRAADHVAPGLAEAAELVMAWRRG